MKISTTPIEGLLLIDHPRWEDERGFFVEQYQQETFRAAGLDIQFVQDNLSYSHQNVLRGLHAQLGPQAQGKLVRVLKGSVFDVAVDIRISSPTFGKYFSIELHDGVSQSLWIPPGFLHGFVALEDHTLFSYKVSTFYDRSGEVGVRWDDQDLQIDWPELGNPFIISDKDRKLPYFKDCIENL